MKSQINLQLHQKEKQEEYLIHKSKSCFLEMTNEMEKKLVILHKGKININNYKYYTRENNVIIYWEDFKKVSVYVENLHQSLTKP